ncbi:RDD family protein [Baekduia sp. Peel2402]|uniref:RDD family protein n=1 Tax=Baekduia sp. Peel2402 TaxID=3458296 RepID=UPI00403ECC87
MSVPPPGWVEQAPSAFVRTDVAPTSNMRTENRRLLDSRRVVARLVDWVMVFLTAKIISRGWGDELGEFALFQCLLLIYNHLFEVTTGATLGKRLVGLRVANLADGGLPTPRQAATRGVIGIFEIGLIAAISIMINKQRRRLGDYAAGTAVVDSRKHPIPARPLFAGAIVYPVVWLVPTLIVCSMAAKGTLPGSYRSQVNDICTQAHAALAPMASTYGAEGMYELLSRRDGMIATLHVPGAWLDRHSQLLLALRRQTQVVADEASKPPRSQDRKAIAAVVSAPPVGLPGYESC